MMRRSLCGAALAGAALVAPANRLAAQQTPVFRAGTDLVTVDVFVRDGSTSVPGLGANDFVVLDNGVRQQVELLEASRVPLDVSLVVDVSGGSPQWWGTPRAGEEVRARLAAIADRARRVLRQEDRLRVLTVDAFAQEAMPFQSAAAPVTIEAEIASGGRASLHDTLIAALLEPVQPDRRHVIIAMTKAEDTLSTADITAVREVARRSGAVLHVVLGPSLIGDTACRDATPQRVPPAGASGWVVNEEVPDRINTCRFPRRQFWHPAVRRVESELAALAEVTGGTYYGLDALGVYRDFSDEVERIFNQYRQGYVLRYTPRGVRREGWHDIDVRVPGRPAATVQARRGYFVEGAPAGSRSTRAAERAPEPWRAALDTLRLSFVAGDYRTFETTLATAPEFEAVIREVRTSPTPWANRPRRDAVFALEIAVAGLNRSDNGARAEAMRWLEQYSTLIRQPLGADAFECAWYWTGTAALQGLIRPALAASFVQRALRRCPEEPRLHLAAAVITDQQWPAGTLRPLPGIDRQIGPSAEQRLAVTSLYAKAMEYPETAVEARLRAAWFAYRVGEFDHAHELTKNAAGAVADPQLGYLRDLIGAQVLRALGRHDEAAAGFQRALAAWPRAQAARLGLMAVEVLRGNHQQAAALAEAVETASEADFDPWWRYWQGDFRAYGGILTRLRELAR